MTTKIVRTGLALLAVLLLVVAALPKLTEWYLLRKESAETKAMYRDYKTRLVTLPAEAWDVKPPSPVLLQAVKDYMEAWDRFKPEAMPLDDTLRVYRNTPDLIDAGELKAKLAKIQPLIEAFRHMVSQPDFTIDAMAPVNSHDIFYALPAADYFSFQNGVKLIALQSLEQSLAGQTAEAMASAELIFKSAKVSSYDSLITQLISVACSSIGERSWREAVDACDDTALLRDALKRQTELAEEIHFFPENVPASFVDRAGMVRLAMRHGIQVPGLDKPMTERRLMGLGSWAEAEYLEQVQMPRAQDNPERAERIRNAILRDRRQGNWFGVSDQRAWRFFGRHFSLVWEPKVFLMGIPNTQECHERARYALARFDLLRLETARKLFTLEHGTTPGDLAALVPEYLSELPMDRFAENKVPYKVAGSVIYSVGPEGIDEQAALSYDSTNGTFSGGDVFYPTAK